MSIPMKQSSLKLKTFDGTCSVIVVRALFRRLDRFVQIGAPFEIQGDMTYQNPS